MLATTDSFSHYGARSRLDPELLFFSFASAADAAGAATYASAEASEPASARVAMLFFMGLSPFEREPSIGLQRGLRRCREGCYSRDLKFS